MKSFVQLHVGSAAYCAVLLVLNWSWSVKYSRQVGLTSESVSPVAFALLLSIGVSLYYAFRCLIAAASRLEKGTKVGEGRWIRSWSVLVYALPLLFHKNSTSNWIDGDGALATTSSGFGHQLSTWVFLFAILGLLLFQIFSRLNLNPEEGRTNHYSQLRGADVPFRG
jgi:hypothetical protein